MAVLGTKVHVPRLRRDLVGRPRLTARLSERLDQGAPPRLVLVSAPAGFGKTTALAQGLARLTGGRGHVAWLSLDADDNDPRRFLEHLVAALQSVGEFSEAAALVAASGAPDLALTSVVNELDLQSGRIVLALDDFHVITAPEVHEMVTFLLDHLPPQAGLAIATRSDPPLPLSRLRARGELVELRAADLRFTPDEARAFLTGVMGLDLPPAEVAALESRTEGWVAGLQLAALSLRGTHDTAEFVADFTGSHRFILDYLVDEVLRSQPEASRRFLLDTSVLQQLTGELCDRVTGGDDSAGRLEALDRNNVFIVPLDEHRDWYRYHHLFAEALRARLSAERPERVPQLHRAAGEWYAAHGFVEEAVGHALRSGDADYAADLVESALPDLRRRRRDVMLREWLTALPAEVTRERPLLGTYLAWTRLVEGDLEGVETVLAQAERALTTRRPVAPAGASLATSEELRTLPATMAVFRASAAQARGDTEAMERHARRALGLTGADDHMARAGALGFLGLAAWGRGDLTSAVDTFSSAVLSMAAAGDVADQLGSTVALADMWVARGRPDKARRMQEDALATSRRHPGATLATLADLHVGLADVLVEQDELEEAAEHLDTARGLGESASLLENRYRWFVASARLRRAEGDLEAAAELLAQAEPLHLPGFFPDVRPIPAQLARVRIAQGRLADAWQWAESERALRADDVSYLAEFAQLTLVRLLLAQHRADGESSRLDEAAGRLDRLAPGAGTGGRDGSLLEIRMLGALVHHARRDEAAAVAQLGDVLRTAAPAGFVRLFLDEGGPMTELAAHVDGTPVTAALVARLQRTAYASPGVTAQEPQTHGLSERELDVLQLLATARTGPQIANELFVSVNTLRTHTKHIFTKLGVNTRRAAVARAGELGLIRPL